MTSGNFRSEERLALENYRQILLSGKHKFPASHFELLDRAEQLITLRDQLEAAGKPVPAELGAAVAHFAIIVKKNLRAMGGGTPEEIADVRNEIFQEFALGQVTQTLPILKSLAASKIGITADGMQQLLPSLELTNDIRINCGLVRKGGQAFYLIELYSGLLLFLIGLGKLYAKRTRFYREDGSIVEESEDVSVTARGLSDLMEFFWGLKQPSGVGGGIERLEPHHLDLAGTLVSCATACMLGHELGHLIMAQSENDIPELVRARKFVKAIPAPKCAPASGEAWREAWEEEIGADILGFDLAVEYWRVRQKRGETPSTPDADFIAYTGMSMFFNGYDMLEQFGNSKGCCSLVTLSHPPAALRLENLSESLAYTNHPRWIEILGFNEKIRALSGKAGFPTLPWFELLERHFQSPTQ